jgi:hypothetical protein
MWIGIVGIVIATLTAIVSSAKEIKHRKTMASKPTLSAWLRRNRLPAVQIALATGAMTVSLLSLVHEHRASQVERRKSRLMQFTLAHLQSKPKFYFYLKTDNVVQNWERYVSEKQLAEEKNAGLPEAFGFVPQSVRDVIFPFASNAQAFPNQMVGEMDFFLGEATNQISFYSSGRMLQLGFPPSVVLLPESKAGWIFDFNKGDTAVSMTLRPAAEWQLGSIYEKILQSSNDRNRPILKFTRWRTSCPASPPKFKEARVTATLWSVSGFKITAPLRVSSFTCDAANSSYSYYLRAAKDPDVIDATSDTTEP